MICRAAQLLRPGGYRLNVMVAEPWPSAATGGTAIGYIHDFVVGEAKNLLMRKLSVGETASLLGFAYPHHFSRLFKKITGLTPSEFLRK